MPDTPGTMTTDRILQTVNYGASRGRPSMQAFGGAGGGGVRRTAMGAPSGGVGYSPGGMPSYGTGSAVAGGWQQPTGQQYRRTDRTALPQGPFLQENYGVDPYGREYVADSQINPGYVDPNLRFQLEHDTSRREGEARDRLAEIRESGNQTRLTSGQEQGWTTGERGRARTWQVEDDARMFERLPGLWGMFTGEGGTSGGGANPPASMAALAAGGGQGLSAAGGVAGQSGAHGGINPGGGVQTGGGDQLPTGGKSATAPSQADQAADLAFARAKDKAGLLAGARLKGARAALANSSLGTQARGTNAILGDAASGLTDVATAQAVAAAQRAADVEDRNYAGGLTRRGQNMGLAPSILALLRSGRPAY